MPLTDPSVAVVLLNWNGKNFLESILLQLSRLTYSNYNVYVIDNNSSDDSVQFIRNAYPSVTLIQLQDNYGFAEGYNRGFSLIKEKYYLMLNSDVEITPDFISPMVELMEADSGIAVCQPKIRALLRKNCFEHAGAAGGMIDMLGYAFCRGRIFEIAEKDKGQYNQVTEIFWATGACCLINRDAYWKVGGMYNYFFMHFEEIDLCWRLITEGYKIMYCPHSTIYHLGGGTLTYTSPRKTYLNFRNNLVMCYRNLPWQSKLWFLPARASLDVLAALSFLIKDRAGFTAVIKAYKDFFKWLFTEKGGMPTKQKSLLSIPVVFRSSIIWQHYVKKKKYYSEL